MGLGNAEWAIQSKLPVVKRPAFGGCLWGIGRPKSREKDDSYNIENTCPCHSRYRELVLGSHPRYSLWDKVRPRLWWRLRRRWRVLCRFKVRISSAFLSSGLCRSLDAIPTQKSLPRCSWTCVNPTLRNSPCSSFTYVHQLPPFLPTLLMVNSLLFPTSSSLHFPLFSFSRIILLLCTLSWLFFVR